MCIRDRVIPFGGSSFESKTAIELEDESSELIYDCLLYTSLF